MDSQTESEREYTIRARSYSAIVDPGGPWLTIRWPGGHVRLGAGAGDLPSRWRVSAVDSPSSTHVTLSADDGRRLRLACAPDALLAWAELPSPAGSPSLLRGPDLPGFAGLFSPEPTALRQAFFGPADRAVAALGSDLTYFRGHWLFSPPPFCFALDGGEGGTLAVGVAAPLEALDFTAFEYDRGAFRFRCDRDPVGPYTSPRLVLLPSRGDSYRGVEAYCDYLRDAGLAPRGTGRTPAEWWREPVFCGWGEQSYRRVRDADYPTLGVEPEKADRYYLPDGIPANSTQATYEDALARLEANGIEPGIVTVDDKWQLCYGLAAPDESRWPDLAGFIAAQHAKGRHVLLWWKLWDGEGLPPDELLGGWPYPVVDPTSPAYLKRLESEVRFALRTLGADGFKIDFLHRGPTPSHAPSRGGLSGVRLHHAMLKALRDAALAAKEDCLLVGHAVNPYFADLQDVVRLNDVSTIPGDPSFLAEMRHRARFARAACPEALIDTDNWPCPDRHQWAEYLAAQPDIGIPSLYYATGIDLSNEPLTPADYDLIREIWARWRAKHRS